MNRTTRTTPARRVAAVLAAGLSALVVALVVAGCSGGDGWPTAAGAASASASPSSSPGAVPPAAPTAPETSVPSSAAAGAGTGTDGAGSGGRCTTGELRGSLGASDGAAGSVNQTLVLTNVGTRTCTLRGFPGVSYVGGDDGRQVGPSAAMSGPRGGDVRLVPGGSAGAEMQLANVANFDAATCRPAPVRGLRVYPPGDTASLFVPRPGTGCAGSTGNSNQLGVQTLVSR